MGWLLSLPFVTFVTHTKNFYRLILIFKQFSDLIGPMNLKSDIWTRSAPLCSVFFCDWALFLQHFIVFIVLFERKLIVFCTSVCPSVCLLELNTPIQIWELCTSVRQFRYIWPKLFRQIVPPPECCIKLSNSMAL